MSKKGSFGKITKPVRDKPRKRPGRHKKRLNKSEKRQHKKRRKGRKRQLTIIPRYPIQNKRKEHMRYKFTITDADGKSETVENMSWKKAFKNILVKDNKFNGWVSYVNKKDNLQTKVIQDGKLQREKYQFKSQ